MIKKNQFALIFLTIVTMLAVWYIKTPVGADNDDPGLETSGDVTDTGRLAELAALREAVRAERSLAAAALDEVIADATTSLTQKELAIKEKKDLSALTEKEVLLEISVIAKGYRDAFVHATASGITILVVANESSYTVANELIVMALDSFGDQYDNVVVKFETVEEIRNK